MKGKIVGVAVLFLLLGAVALTGYSAAAQGVTFGPGTGLESYASVQTGQTGQVSAQPAAPTEGEEGLLYQTFTYV